jgi:hypothetical protein
MEEPVVVSSEDVLEALRLWHGGSPAIWPLARLRLSLLAGVDEQAAHGTLAEAGSAARNRAVLGRGLDVLRGQDPGGHDLLLQRFQHRRDVMELANQLNISKQGLLYRQRQAISQLTNILIGLEESASRAWQQKIMGRLELPSYQHLVGIEGAQDVLTEALLADDAYFVTAVDGLGGIGKTALTDQVVRNLMPLTRFDDIAWVTAKQTHLSSMGRLQVESGRPALTFPMLVEELATQFELPPTASQLQRQRSLKEYLRDYACLVVVDNLETVADYQALLPELQQWQRPSKFLLTSRRRLLDQPAVFSLSLQELPPAAALELMRREARRGGFTELEEADDGMLQQIYEAVGGNPLALKLLIGQLRFHSLPEVLRRLQPGSHVRNSDGLFDYIYGEVWESLSENSKETLISLLDAGSSGFTFEYLTSLITFPVAALPEALEELILLSLVEQVGALESRRYRLHRLTELFLRRMLEEGE